MKAYEHAFFIDKGRSSQVARSAHNLAADLFHVWLFLTKVIGEEFFPLSDPKALDARDDFGGLVQVDFHFFGIDLFFDCGLFVLRKKLLRSCARRSTVAVIEPFDRHVDLPLDKFLRFWTDPISTGRVLLMNKVLSTGIRKARQESVSPVPTRAKTNGKY